jgi:hypothetical protein
MITEKEFTIEYKDFKSFLKDVESLEEKYNGLMVRAEIVGNVAKVLMLCGIGSKDVYVSVWDCRATLILGSKTEKELTLSNEQKEVLEEWKFYVVEDENDGAINWSGAYYPSYESLQVLKAILANNLKRAWMTLNRLQKKRKHIST